MQGSEVAATSLDRMKKKVRLKKIKVNASNRIKGN